MVCTPFCQFIMSLGCFWGLELAFQRVPGVLLTEVGYTQGNTRNPTYEEVSRGVCGNQVTIILQLTTLVLFTGQSGHVEAVQVVFDTSGITHKLFHSTSVTSDCFQL